MAQGFLQSLQSPFAASLGFTSPLGSLSPFPAPHHIQPLQTSIGLATPTSPLASAAAMSPSSSRGLTMAQIVQSNAQGKAPGSPSRISAPAVSSLSVWARANLVGHNFAAFNIKMISSY